MSSRSKGWYNTVLTHVKVFHLTRLTSWFLPRKFRLLPNGSTDWRRLRSLQSTYFQYEYSPEVDSRFVPSSDFQTKSRVDSVVLQLEFIVFMSLIYSSFELLPVGPRI